LSASALYDDVSPWQFFLKIVLNCIEFVDSFALKVSHLTACQVDFIINIPHKSAVVLFAFLSVGVGTLF